MKGIRIYTANRWTSRDPTSYQVWGRKDVEDAWQVISEGMVRLPLDRNIGGIAINSSFDAGDSNLYHFETSFVNEAYYSEYKITFPTGGDDIGFEIGEVELPGYILSGTPPTLTPAPQVTSSPTKSVTGNPTSSPISPVKSPTRAPSRFPTSSPSKSATKSPVSPQPTSDQINDVTPVKTVLSTDSTVVRVGGSHTKNPRTLVDETTNKFVINKDGTMAPGAEFTPTWPSTIVTGIRIYTANDGISRDPASYVLEGRQTAGSGDWQMISSGDLNLPAERNAQGQTISSSVSGPDASLYNQEVLFSNTVVYAQYRLTFPTTKNSKNTISDSVQIAEVELPGSYIA